MQICDFDSYWNSLTLVLTVKAIFHKFVKCTKKNPEDRNPSIGQAQTMSLTFFLDWKKALL